MWDVKDAITLTLDNGIGDVTGKTSIEVSPEENIDYILTATNSVGTVTKTCTINVKAASRLIMVGEPVPLRTKAGDFHGYGGTVKNIGNKKCGNRDWSFQVKMYDKNGVILFEQFDTQYFGNKLPTVLEGETKDWQWSWIQRFLARFIPEKAKQVDLSKTTFKLKFPNWQAFE